MDLSKISKAIAAGAGGALATAGVVTTVIPPDVSAPWWGYVIAYAVGVIAPFALTYIAPKNAG